MEFCFYMPTRMHFGSGKLDLVGGIVKQYGSKCLLVTTKNEAPLNGLFDRVKQYLENSGVEVKHFDQVLPNPSVDIIEAGIDMANAFGVEVILAIGGGSSIDTAKSIALLKEQDHIDWNDIFTKYSSPFEAYASLSENPIPLISVPTTAGTGSEVTQAAVISKGADKNTIFHPSNYSRETILDPELLLTLPNRLTASTGFDSFCHAFESYISKDSSRFIELLAVEAMTLVIENLPKALADPKNIVYREKLMYAQSLAGISLANGGASAPHPLSEIVGGITHISHGEALALLFPEFIDEFVANNTEKFAKVAKLFNTENANVGINTAAMTLSKEVAIFLKAIDLYKTAEDYQISDSQYDLMYHSPILGFLPFGSQEILMRIIEKALKERK